jgi:hypothetical protein
MVGAMTFGGDHRLSFSLLGWGLVGRALFELRISIAKAMWLSESSEKEVTTFVVVVLCCAYVGGFLFPGLLWIDARRKIKIDANKAAHGRTLTASGGR